MTSLQEMIGADDTKYGEVEAHGVKFRLGSLNSADMIDWIEAQGDPAQRRFAGILLLVMSLVGPEGERVPRAERQATVEVFKAKNAASNRKIIRLSRELNNLDTLGTVLTETLKNVSGGASTDASPSDSPDTSGK